MHQNEWRGRLIHRKQMTRAGGELGCNMMRQNERWDSGLMHQNDWVMHYIMNKGRVEVAG